MADTKTVDEFKVGDEIIDYAGGPVHYGEGTNRKSMVFRDFPWPGVVLDVRESTADPRAGRVVTIDTRTGPRQVVLGFIQKFTVA